VIIVVAEDGTWDDHAPARSPRPSLSRGRGLGRSPVRLSVLVLDILRLDIGLGDVGWGEPDRVKRLMYLRSEFVECVTASLVKRQLCCCCDCRPFPGVHTPGLDLRVVGGIESHNFESVRTLPARPVNAV
jgi:hypothetical protein